MDLREDKSVSSVIKAPVTSGNLIAALPWKCLTLGNLMGLVRSFAP